MRKYIFALVIIGSVANASNEDACKDMKDIVLKSNVHGLNIANWNSTRTPEGGPYKLKTMKCENHKCELVSESATVTQYEPGHPDADKDGYVLYPDINIEKEISAMTELGHEYQRAKRDCE